MSPEARLLVSPVIVKPRKSSTPESEYEAKTGDDILRAAQSAAYALDEIELVKYLKGCLGRPLVAFVTKTAGANTVSRWASGRVRPDREVWERMRTLALVHLAVKHIVGGSATTAAQWLVGANPTLDGVMPAAELREHHDRAVFSAVRMLAQTL